MAYKVPQLPSYIPAPVKIGLYIGGGWLAWKYAVKPLLGYLGLADSAAETDFKKLVKQLNTTPTNDGSIKPNITELQAKEIANTLYAAMDQFGTDFTTMTKAINGLNGKDLQLVYAAFGVPKYFGTGRGEYFGDPLTLFQWFTSELSGGQLAEMRYLWVRSGLKF